MFKRLMLLLLFLVIFGIAYPTLINIHTYLFVDVLNYYSVQKKEIIGFYTKEAPTAVFIFFLFYFITISVLSIFTIFYGVRGIFVISLIAISLFWFVQILFIDEFLMDSITIYSSFEFINNALGVSNFKFTLKISFINYCFLFLTTSIGLCAVVYSLSYFKNEPHTDRFILLINWFILSMSILVTADNALLLFLGWELIGLTSFLLINFWTQRRGTLKSAFKAFTFNKFSDVFLLFFIIMISHQTGSLDLTAWQTYFLIGSSYNLGSTLVPALFLLLAASIKSAQIIGHLWLPDSMEAPIPASALIHSATLVSAGVYLLLKFNWILNTAELLPFIMVLGAITALYGAIVSAAQTDCKKLLAYSTISHCGFLFIAVGLNNVYLVVTYLYLHGFFKALTFFCVGNIVKVSRGYQDTRKMGQLFLALPVESTLLVISAANLGALPFTVGYFYKALLQTVLLGSSTGLIVLPFIFIAMLCSIIYVFRLVYYSMFDIQKGNSISFDALFKHNQEDEEYSNTTVFSIFFIVALLVLAVYLYMFYLLFCNNFMVLNNNFNIEYLEVIQTIQKNNTIFYYLFYIFFGIIIFFIVRVTCRVEFSNLKQNYQIYFFFLFILVSQVIFYLQLFLIY